MHVAVTAAGWKGRTCIYEVQQHEEGLAEGRVGVFHPDLVLILNATSTAVFLFVKMWTITHNPCAKSCEQRYLDGSRLHL